LHKKHVSKQGGCIEKPVAAIPKSIVSHDCMTSEDCIFSDLLVTRCNAKGKSIALSGFEGYLPCSYAMVRLIVFPARCAAYLYDNIRRFSYQRNGPKKES
jgi:hypothetical protein